MPDQVQTSGNRLRQWLGGARGKALLLCVGLALGLLAAELVVRVLDLPPKPLKKIAMWHYRLSDNPLLRYEYIPNYDPAQRAYHMRIKHFATNSAGFRDREYPRRKPRNTFRIVSVGDSVAAGLGIESLDDIYAKRLETLLNKRSGKRVEVLNMGVSGYEAVQVAETARTRGLEYDPDLVLVAYVLNDSRDDVDGGIHAFLLEQWAQASGQSVARDARRPPAAVRWLVGHSRLAFFCYYRLRAIAQRNENPGNKPKQKVDLVARGFSILKEIQDSGVPVVVFIFPAFDHPFSKYPYGDVHKAVEGTAKEYGLTAVELLPSLARVTDDAPSLAVDSIHPNAKGHSAVAEAMASWLLREGPLRGKNP